MAAGGGATVVSGDSNPKTKLFLPNPLSFFMLVSNPKTKSPKSLPKRLDRSLKVADEIVYFIDFELLVSVLSFFLLLLLFLCVCMVVLAGS
jgi:hypothetical protein